MPARRASSSTARPTGIKDPEQSRFLAGWACRLFLLLLWALTTVPVVGADLEDEPGRSEVRIRSAPFHLYPGRTVAEYRLPERLKALGYRRVHRRPDVPGEFFWGNEVFWIHGRAHRLRGRDRGAALFGLRLRRSDGMVLGAVDRDGAPAEGVPWLEPELLSESLDTERAMRLPVRFDTLPEHVWRPVLAAEDARFFDHSGLDARALARALLANIKAGGVAQGGSTITQQLIKMRDLTPKRTLGRKASEAVRALALEAEYDKEEILEAYLNHVYWGHVGGVAVHGLGAASRAWFSREPADLDLQRAALLAAMIQGPNRLSPVRHPERARERRNRVLDRMQDLGWATSEDVRRARGAPLGLRVDAPARPPAPHFRRWVAAIVEERAPNRHEKGRGFVVETELDPELQRLAERSVADHLDSLRRGYRSLRGVPLQAALVAVDAQTGGVLAHVGGDPGGPAGGFDRVRQARRQPGSTVKPLLLLEAFESCGRRDALTPATRIADEPLTIHLPSGPWSPVNQDGAFRGVVGVRPAMRESRNVPFVRMARWCGYVPTADRMRRAGLALPDEPPPSFALGSVETSPLDLARAYTVFSTPGRVLEPRPVRRIEKPGGRRLWRGRVRDQAVVSPSAAWLARSVLLEAGGGTARAAAIPGVETAAKTGTSSGRRDAWLAGQAGRIVTIVWVGRDDGKRIGLTGSVAAAPLWRAFMERAVPARPPLSLLPPRGVVERWVEPSTGLLVRSGRPGARPEWFRREALPPRRRFWRADEPVPAIR